MKLLIRAYVTDLRHQEYAPDWLQNSHAALDRAVWDAYGWPEDEIPADVAEDVIFSRLTLAAAGPERGGGEVVTNSRPRITRTMCGSMLQPLLE